MISIRVSHTVVEGSNIFIDKFIDGLSVANYDKIDSICKSMISIADELDF